MNSPVAPLITAADVFPPAGRRARFTVLDVRAPVEVARGQLPHAVNIPILEDDERRQVGIAYKGAGQEAAVKLGLELTRMAMAGRVARWREYCAKGPTAIACWRGGLRSQIAQSYLGENPAPRVAGGYKALRAYLLAEFLSSLEGRQVLTLTGMTGSGKTDLLESLTAIPRLLALDLEGIAHHRGSAFGHIGEQPAQQSFENQLAANVVLHSGDTLLVEDESRRIGAVHLPEPLFSRISQGPVLLLDAPWQERIQRIHDQYILKPAYQQGPERAFLDLKEAVSRLRRRLGGAVVERLYRVLDEVLAAGNWGDSAALEPFIGPLLQEYYDPLYHRAVERMGRPLLARGTKEELTNWIRQLL
ncbi:MAG: tRNA 2-selenouridine(34) synthase MnmH [Trueperaceae bacterium]